MTHQEWRLLWMAALENMPAMSINKNPAYPKWSNKLTYRRGSPTALRICLGYNVYSGHGQSNAQLCHYVAVQRGSKPRTKARQTLLQALAGPHGPTLARVKLIKLGQASRFKYWPKGTL